MSEYDGLNLPQLMELLHDIVMPQPIPWIPATIGWLIVGVWLLSLIGIALVHNVARYRKNRYRREAQAVLDRISESDGHVAFTITSLIKRTALTAYSREEVASLSGPDWAEFLIRSSGDDPEVRKSASVLVEAAYQPNVNFNELKRVAGRWIKAHRA